MRLNVARCGWLNGINVIRWPRWPGYKGCGAGITCNAITIDLLFCQRILDISNTMQPIYSLSSKRIRLSVCNLANMQDNNEEFLPKH